MYQVCATPLFTFLLTVGGLLQIQGQMLQVCEEPAKRITPKVLLSSKAKDFTPNDHLGYTFSTWKWNSFTFNCWALFPIRWVFDFDQDDGEAVRDISIFQSRNFSDFYDNSTYEYRSVMTLRYQSRVTKEQVFSCQAISSPCDRRLVTSKPIEQGRKLHIRFESDLNIPEIEQDLEPEIERNETMHNETCQALFYYMKMQNEWYFCCHSSTAFYDRGPPLFFTSMDANTLENVQRNSNVQPETCVKEIDNHIYCPHGINLKNSQAVGIACDLESSDTISMNKVIVGLGQDNDGQPPPIYFDWRKIDPGTMMNLDVPNPLTAYAKETVNVTCYISVAYFSHGGFIATSDSMNNFTIYKSIKIDESSEPYVDKINAYKIEFEVLITKSTEKVYCFAPIWNTTEWVNKSVAVTVLETPPLEIINGSRIETIHWSEENVQPTLTCVANGFPAPRVEWRFLTKALTFEHQKPNVANIESTLTFMKVDKSVDGDYLCRASNTMGDVEKLFRITFQGETSGVNTTLASSVSASGILIICVLLSALIILWRKNVQQNKQIQQNTADDLKNHMEGTPCSPNDPSYNYKFEVDRKQIRINETDLLGSGAFGKVYKGQLVTSLVESSNSLITVAIKIPQNVDINYFKAILSEIKIMASIAPHDNVVQLMGACTKKMARMEVYMAVEFCANGNLKNYLRKYRRPFTPTTGDYQKLDTVFEYYQQWNEAFEPTLEPDFGPQQLIQWAYEIADGMNFLASYQIVHGDLAARNIFLTENRVAKIGDFGLARVLAGRSIYVKKPTVECPLPWKWMAIEALERMEFSIKSDVWSYGMVLWEIFSLAEPPYAGVSFTAKFLNDLKDGLREEQPKFASDNMYALMRECWKSNPHERPIFSSLQSILEKELNPSETTLSDAIVETMV